MLIELVTKSGTKDYLRIIGTRHCGCHIFLALEINTVYRCMYTVCTVHIHTYIPISRPIRRTVIFSLEILEKNNDECAYFNFSNLLEENKIVTYQN